ncbi:asparagine synthase-related protein [Marinitenerispora sediminis]|uniref:asparagine synthase-related protein n=1 Tax=Marinitenerispora sediminis TaxID=1931232 RepID=UPI001F3262E6|nr:asparagine synthase-related protein [Marinitenerispora sediminis]
MSDHVWFAVFPDDDGGGAAARELRRQAVQLFTHASGRPWLIGRWPPGEVTVAGVGTAMIAVFGRCSVGAAELTALIRDTPDIGVIEHRTRTLAGSFHLVASVSGMVWARGAASGTRRLFHTRVGGATVAADRADVLARLGDASVDERALALRLVTPAPAHTLEERSVWRGVHSVPSDHAIVLLPGGTSRVERWWRAPEAGLSLAEGAVRVADALSGAVATCTTGGGIVSADLSGGLDSTALCFLTARTGIRLVTHRWGAADVGNDDAVWARRARAALVEAEHQIAGTQRLSPWFSGLVDPRLPLDEPFRWVRGIARVPEITATLVDAGSRLHLSGQGADELFTGTALYLHDLLRVRPLAAVRAARGFRALHRWPLEATARALLDRESYRAAYDRAGRSLTDPVPRQHVPHLGWMLPARLPAWATDDAAALAREAVRDAAETAAPLAATRGRHATLAAVRAAGVTLRSLSALYRSAGIPLAAPFLDDTVVNAALAVRPEEQCTPFRYKPLLAEALRGVLPEELLTRRTKGDFSADAFAGLRYNRPDLVALTEELHLAKLGLVDPVGLREAVTGLHPSATALSHLEATLGVEAWLRSTRFDPHRPTAAFAMGGQP